ncbi:MAG: ABC transporter ATP-binding protein [Propionibacteriaceae bacterium]|nr:ABC transporter ATP-binding protein [Propionibacteriaceae bacterium]
MSDSAVRLSGVSFSYSGVESDSLAKLELSLRPGEFVVLAGPSGSGKTTLTRLINGLIPHYYEGSLLGQVVVDGIDPSANALWRLPVGSVFQNPRAQFFTTDTTSEIAFGVENLGLPTAEILSRVEEAISAMGLADLRDRSVFALSGGEKQRVACASVAAVRPAIYVLDEPSANLDLESTRQLREIMAGWKAGGATVVVAEHRLGFLRDLADRVLLFADGQLRTEFSGADFRSLNDEQLHQLGLRSAWGETMTATQGPPGGDCFEITGLRCRHRSTHAPGLSAPRPEDAVHVDHLRIPKGKVTVLVGANGSGKTTLATWLGGLRRDREGRLNDGRRNWNTAERRRRVFLVLQDVNHQLFTESVAEEIALSARLAGPTGLPILSEAEIMERLDLVAVADRHPMSLSTGQKQRVAVATALASGREVVVLDEPTAGLDLHHMNAVADALRVLADSGRTVLVATHDIELVAACADLVIRLDHGILTPV